MATSSPKSRTSDSRWMISEHQRVPSDMAERRDTRRRPNLLGTILFAVIWVAVAIARPTTTFHLAPLIVAMWPGMTEGQSRTGATLAAAGFVIAAGTTIALSAAGLLRGPSLLPWGGPAVESLVAAALGGLIGLFPGAIRHGSDVAQ